MTILMLAPAAGMNFVGAPSGSTYVSDENAIVYIVNNSVADQLALIADGCATLNPTPGGIVGTQTGTAYTVQTTDQGNNVTFTSNSAVTVTLPNNFLVGFSVKLLQFGTGQVTAVAQSGGSIVTPNASSTQSQYGALSATVVANTGGTNAEWLVSANPFPWQGVNVLSYIPASYIPAILNGTTTVDVSAYLNAAHVAAGAFGAVYYPAGTYLAQNVQYLDGQSIIGTGRGSTIIHQASPYTQPIFVAANWYNNNVNIYQNGLDISKVWLKMSDTATGGSAIIVYSRRANIENCRINVLAGQPCRGIYLTTNTANGTPAAQNMPGCRIVNNIIEGFGNGGIFVDSTSEVSDIYVGLNIIQFCGNTAGTIASIDAPHFQGWNVFNNKIESAPVRLIQAGSQGTHSTQIVGNYFECDFTNPLGGGAQNISVSIICNNLGPNTISNNIFKGSALADLTKLYTLLNIDIAAASSSTANVVNGNSFSCPAGMLAANITAFNVTTLNQALLNGVCIGSTFWNMTAASYGNGWANWAPVNNQIAEPNITAHAGGGQVLGAPITGNVCVVRVCANAGDSVTLQNTAQGTGQSIFIYNNGAQSCNVFPNGTDQINKAGASVAFALAANSSVLLFDTGVGLWYTR